MIRRLTRNEFESSISHIQASNPDRHWPHDRQPNEVVREGQAVIEASPLGQRSRCGTPISTIRRNTCYTDFRMLMIGRPCVRSHDGQKKVCAAKLQQVAGKLQWASADLNVDCHNPHGGAASHRGLSEESPLTAGGIHVGEGMNHMGRLANLVERATMRGRACPPYTREWAMLWRHSGRKPASTMF